MKISTLLILCSLILPLWILAEQSEDHLIVDGKGQFVRADPLNRYLSNFCKEERLDAYIDNFCVPHWPDYTRYWELKDKRLYLLKIAGDKTEEEYPLELLFPLYDGSPVEAKWFTGIVSSRLGDSPVIQLNREFYEEESVIRFVKGKEVERFTIDHRERWISYSKRLMDKHHLLADHDLEFPGDSLDTDGGMVEFLEDVFSPVTHPSDKPSKYYPVIEIEFNADLDGLKLKEAHRGLSGYELLETVAEETRTVLDVAISNRMVFFEIREPEATDHESSAPLVTEHAAGGSLSE
ncbi:MAG: hypothetical protein DRP64_08160 [Verrucomicrobia bacterium]|nr:MAG: hypothetical protein DRP64_08160 [Verrucomicrobiota bacterium]